MSTLPTKSALPAVWQMKEAIFVSDGVGVDLQTIFYVLGC